MTRLRLPTLVGRVEKYGFDKFNPKKIFAFDTETTGLDPWGTMGVDRVLYPCRPFAYSLCDENGNTAYVRWMINPFTREVIKDDKTFALLQEFLGDPSLAKVFHNFAFDNHMSECTGFKLTPEFHDTLIRMHCINPDEPTLALKPLCKKYLDISDDDQKDLKASVISGRAEAKKKGWAIAESTEADYWLADPDLCRKYALTDAFRTMSLFLAQEDKVKEPAIKSLVERERKLMIVLRDMESRGVAIDMKKNKKIEKFYEGVVKEASKVIEREAGSDFNPDSPQQMQRLFFGELGFKPIKYNTKGKAKIYSDCPHCDGEGCKICQNTGRSPKCDGAFLETIGVKRNGDEVSQGESELAWQMLRHSAASTMLGFVSKYKTLAVYENDHYVIHPNYRQAGPVTGRLSCSNPNLQNVASDESGKKKTDVPYLARDVFIPRKDFIFLIPDYSQIEVWILALLAKDHRMIDALAAGGDAHQTVADLIWPKAYDRKVVEEAKHLPPDKLTDKHRSALKTSKTIRKRAKNLQFCKIYGGGLEKIAGMIGCSEYEAADFIRQYDKTFPAVKEFMHRVVKQVKTTGTAVNAYGREYTIDKKFAYRATNYLVQGSAADLMKNAMIYAHELSKTRQYRGKMHLLLTIHDELLAEIHKSINNMQTMKDLASAMAADYKFLGAPIPFPIGMKIAEEFWSKNREVQI